MAVVGVPGPEPLSRDQRIAELKLAGWSLRSIAIEVHLSAEGVRQALHRMASDHAIEDREASLLSELGALLVRVESKRARIAQIRRQLKAIADEREDRAIDRLNRAF